MRKAFRFILITLIMALLMIGCSAGNNNNDNDNNNNDELRVFTLEELAQYNGLDGNDAYVAVDGIVYDVTNVPQWSGGSHQGVTAGGDRTAIIKEMSPHGTRVLSGLPIVGRLE